MWDSLQVSENAKREDFVKTHTHPVVTWTFGDVSSDRPLRSSTYERLSTSRSQESEGRIQSPMSFLFVHSCLS